MMLFSKQYSKISRVSCVPLELLQADFGVGISRFGPRIVPSRGGEGCPVASMGGSWPDDHRIQIPTVMDFMAGSLDA